MINLIFYIYKIEVFMSWIIGVDVGGTFTDFCARNNNSGETLIHKRPSTPNDPAIAILNGLNEIKLKFYQSKKLQISSSKKSGMARTGKRRFAQ